MVVLVRVMGIGCGAGVGTACLYLGFFGWRVNIFVVKELINLRHAHPYDPRSSRLRATCEDAITVADW